MGHPPEHPRRRLGRNSDRHPDRRHHPPDRPGQRPHAHLRRDVLRQGRVVPPHPRLRGDVAAELRPHLRRRRHVEAFSDGLLRRPPAHREVDHRPGHEALRTGRPRRLAHHHRDLRRHHRATPVPPRVQPLPQPCAHAHRGALPGHRRPGHRHEPHVHPRRLPRDVRARRLPLRRQGPAVRPSAPDAHTARMGPSHRAALGMARPARLPPRARPPRLCRRTQRGQPPLAARSRRPVRPRGLGEMVRHLRPHPPRPVRRHPRDHGPLGGGTPLPRSRRPPGRRVVGLHPHGAPRDPDLHRLLVRMVHTPTRIRARPLRHLRLRGCAGRPVALPPRYVEVPQRPRDAAHLPVEPLHVARTDSTDLLPLGQRGGRHRMPLRQLRDKRRSPGQPDPVVDRHRRTHARRVGDVLLPQLARGRHPDGLPRPLRTMAGLRAPDDLHLLHGGLRALRSPRRRVDDRPTRRRRRP